MSEQSNSPEHSEPPPLEQLPTEMGFTETPAMVEERRSLEADYTLEVSQIYQLMGEQQIDDTAQSRDESDRQRIGLIITMALLRKRAGLLADYTNDLQDAADCAYGIGLTDLAVQLEDEIDSVE